MPRLTNKSEQCKCKKCKKSVNLIYYCIICSAGICYKCLSTKCLNNEKHKLINEMHFNCNVCNRKKRNNERATLTTCTSCKKNQKISQTRKY